MRVMWSRVDLEGAREINTRRGRAFLALAISPRDGATGSHDRESLLVTARFYCTIGIRIRDLSRPLAFYALTSTRV